MNDAVLGELCFTVAGRPHIKGSKSNVTVNAWPPQTFSFHTMVPDSGKKKSCLSHVNTADSFQNPPETINVKTEQQTEM